MNNPPLYISSEQTLYDNLKENNSLSLNTSTFEVSRSANHITTRLDHVSQRISQIQTSLSKQRNTNCSTQHKKTQKPPCINHQCIDCKIIFNQHNSNNKQMLEKMQKIKKDLENKKQQLERIQNKFILSQTEVIEKEKKYLEMEKKYILLLNQVKNKLERVQQKNWRNQCEKMEINDRLSREINKYEELEEKLFALVEEKHVWEKKLEAMECLRKKSIQNLQKKQTTLDSTQNSSEGITLLKDFVKSLKNISDIGNSSFFDSHRNKKMISSVNQCKKVKIDDMHRTVQPLVTSSPKMIQSYCIEDSSIILPQIPLTQIDDSNDVYRMLFMQAESIEKLMA